MRTEVHNHSIDSGVDVRIRPPRADSKPSEKTPLRRNSSTQLSQLTSIDLPDADSLAAKVAANPNGYHCTQYSLFNGAHRRHSGRD